MTAQIETLIDKLDNFEVVRDKIALILAEEVAKQKALAILATQDPADYDLRVFIERSNAFETFLENDPVETPLVNVWFDSSTFPEDSGGTVTQQTSESIFNLDIYGYGVSADDPTGGHKPGDREAALEVQRAVRLVRNILMSSHYNVLDLEGLVWQRWPETITVFRPEMDGNPIEQIVGARIALRVTFGETAPQIVPGVLEFVSLEVCRAETGLVTLKADYDYVP